MQHGCRHDAHLNKGIIDTSSIGQEKATARGHAVKEEELLLGAQQAVIPLLGLLHAVLVVLHALLVWKGDTIDSLQQQKVTTVRSKSQRQRPFLGSSMWYC